MSEEKTGPNVGKIVLFIALLTAVIVFALAIFKETSREIRPVPLHTPLPEAEEYVEEEGFEMLETEESSAEAENEGDAADIPLDQSSEE